MPNTNAKRATEIPIHALHDTVCPSVMIILGKVRPLSRHLTEADPQVPVQQ